MLTSAFVLAVLVTAALHSALLCAAALLVGRFVTDAGRRSQLCRVAAVGAVATAVAALAIGGGARFGAAPGVAEPSALEGASAPAPGAAEGDAEGAAAVPDRAGAARQLTLPLAQPLGPPAPWALGVWAAVAALWMGRDAVRRRRFVARLEREALDAKTPRGAALSASDALLSPVVLSSREVCVPRALWTSATAAERAAILAHEDAHIARRDPAWRAALRTVRALLWFQPLLPLVIARESDAAELDCDERAVRGGAEGLSLARVLARVAAAGMTPAAPFPAMARRGALVVERVARLTSAGRPSAAPGGARFTAGLACALVAFACTAPRVAAPSVAAEASSAPENAIVIEVDRYSRANLYGPGESVARARVPMVERRSRAELGDALAALLAEPAFPTVDGRPEGSFEDAFFVPNLRANPLIVRVQPDTPFAVVQHVMAQAARPGTALWNIVVEDPTHSYRLPLPVDSAALRGALGASIRIESSANDLDLRYGVGEARALMNPEVQEGDEAPAPRALRWFDAAGLEAFLRAEAEAGRRMVEIDPRTGTTFAEVATVLDAVERAGKGEFAVIVAGSYE